MNFKGNKSTKYKNVNLLYILVLIETAKGGGIAMMNIHNRFATE
jgi:hypothetical protein